MVRRIWIGIFCAALTAALCVSAFFAVRARFPRPHLDVVEDSGVDPSLVYAMMKAESGFDEKAQSRAGAVGLMQLLPSTARFICMRNSVPFNEEMLFDGSYNTRLGTLYIRYLSKKFPVMDTMLAAYNAGEGVVSDWLSDENLSKDGTTLSRIPYPETARYLKKVKNFKKIYEILY